jgi:anhydro-N-acetylmuramic acid kinase
VELRRLQVILGGGGAKNPTLRRMLKVRLDSPGAQVWKPATRQTRRSALPAVPASWEILTHDDFGIPDSAKEALAFAILAHATLQGRPSNVIGSTGARRAVVLGKISPGHP